MRLQIFRLSVLTAMVVMVTSLSFSQNYSVYRITDNSYNDQYPLVNNNGTIVWVACPEEYGICSYPNLEIFLFDGENVVRLTENETEDSHPDINDNGNVVWQHYDGNDFEILLYDGSTITSLTDDTNGHDINPQINDNNDVVWRTYYGHTTCSQTEMFMYSNSQISQLTTHQTCSSAPRINDLGQVVWSDNSCGMFGGACHTGHGGLVFFDGSVSTRIVASNYFPREPQINNFGEIVWSERFELPGREIFTYDGLNVNRLTTNDYADIRPQINDNGFIVWEGPRSGFGPTTGEINLFNGAVSVPLTNNELADALPQINNSNLVVWEGLRGDSTEILLFDGSTTMELTDDDWEDRAPRISDTGFVVWMKYQSYQNHEIYLAVPDQELTVEILVPTSDQALQDEVQFAAVTSGFFADHELSFFVREPNGDLGEPIGHDDLEAVFNSGTDRFEYLFDTTHIPDGFYITYATASDGSGNELTSEIVPFRIRNWSTVEMLPMSKEFRAGRTIPIKFEIRIDESVDPARPFVYNEELEIKIFDGSMTEVQTAEFGTKSTDYRIDPVDEIYITNFKTDRTPDTYTVDILRKGYLVDSFDFTTTKR